MILKPLCFEAKKAHEEGAVFFDENKNAHVLISGEEKVIPLEHQYNLVDATFFGLNERLTLSSTSPILNQEGKTLRDFFNEEWELYNEALEKSDGRQIDYGWYTYYPKNNDLVLYAPPFWHKVVAVASSSKLLSDDAMKLSWKEIRSVFEQTVVGVAGCSVGSTIAHALIMDLRPDHIKLADKSLYKMENINRVRLNYKEIVKNNRERGDSFALPLQNKAQTVAEQIYGIDPFIDIHVYEDGIHEQNINQFFDGAGNEPPIQILVEEVDDPRIKILLRQEARKRKIPVLMMTDIGSSVQLDLLRYDQNQNWPLSYGISDEKLIEAMEAVYDNPGNKKIFFEFVDALIGTDYRTDELQRILEGKSEIPTSTLIPQLGSTASLAGAIAAETIARMRLGLNYPPRMLFNKKTFDVKKYF